MTWTNAFDVGACTVIVTSYDGTSVNTLFSSVMAKGDSQDFTAYANTYTVAVSIDGVASLSGPQFGVAGGDLSLRVVPTYAITGSARVSDMTADLGTAGSTNVIATGNFDDGPYIDLTGAGSAWTPDPCDLSGAVEMSMEGEAVHPT